MQNHLKSYRFNEIKVILHIVKHTLVAKVDTELNIRNTPTYLARDNFCLVCIIMSQTRLYFLFYSHHPYKLLSRTV